MESPETFALSCRVSRTVADRMRDDGDVGSPPSEVTRGMRGSSRDLNSDSTRTREYCNLTPSPPLAPTSSRHQSSRTSCIRKPRESPSRSITRSCASEPRSRSSGRKRSSRSRKRSASRRRRSARRPTPTKTTSKTTSTSRTRRALPPSNPNSRSRASPSSSARSETRARTRRGAPRRRRRRRRGVRGSRRARSRSSRSAPGARSDAPRAPRGGATRPSSRGDGRRRKTRTSRGASSSDGPSRRTRGSWTTLEPHSWRRRGFRGRGDARSAAGVRPRRATRATDARSPLRTDDDSESPGAASSPRGARTSSRPCGDGWKMKKARSIH